MGRGGFQLCHTQAGSSQLSIACPLVVNAARLCEHLRRRAFLLAHFGETLRPGGCTGCDFCDKPLVREQLGSRRRDSAGTCGSVRLLPLADVSCMLQSIIFKHLISWQAQDWWCDCTQSALRTPPLCRPSSPRCSSSASVKQRAQGLVAALCKAGATSARGNSTHVSAARSMWHSACKGSRQPRVFLTALVIMCAPLFPPGALIGRKRAYDPDVYGAEPSWGSDDEEEREGVESERGSDVDDVNTGMDVGCSLSVGRSCLGLLYGVCRTP